MKTQYEKLNNILEKIKTVSHLYRPSSFWADASEIIVSEIKEFGVENFRRLECALGYFVPNYGMPANSFDSEIEHGLHEFLVERGSKKQSLAMQEFLSGYLHALSDYRVFISADNTNKKPYLQDFSESNYGNPIEQFCFDNKLYSRSALNYLLGLCFLKKNLKIGQEISTVLEIGGGFGTLGEILSFTKDIKYIDVDIPPMSFIAQQYLSNIYGKDVDGLVADEGVVDIKSLKPCSVINSWDIERLVGSIDLFVNFISFQEMEPEIVANYLGHIRRLKPKYILLRNMREGKQIITDKEIGGVKVPIKSDDYAKIIGDGYKLIDKSVIQFGYKTVDGYHSELLLFGICNE